MFAIAQYTNSTCSSPGGKKFSAHPWIIFLTHSSLPCWHVYSLPSSFICWGKKYYFVLPTLDLNRLPKRKTVMNIRANLLKFIIIERLYVATIGDFWARSVYPGHIRKSRQIWRWKSCLHLDWWISPLTVGQSISLLTMLEASSGIVSIDFDWSDNSTHCVAGEGFQFGQ